MNERRIKLRTGDLELAARLNDGPTADLVWSALPITASVNTWGDEIYFRTDVEDEEHDAHEVVEMGDIGYWPPGQALCLFFGATPASRGDEIRPASPVNVVGAIEGDPAVLRAVEEGDRMIVEKA